MIYNLYVLKEKSSWQIIFLPTHAVISSVSAEEKIEKVLKNIVLKYKTVGNLASYLEKSELGEVPPKVYLDREEKYQKVKDVQGIYEDIIKETLKEVSLKEKERKTKYKLKPSLLKNKEENILPENKSTLVLGINKPKKIKLLNL